MMPSAIGNERTTTEASGVAVEGAKKKTFRPDIQGLRMLAVIAVVLDHLFAWPSGGFIGVDVFFVISGFLITSLLIREQEKSRTISFVGFYRRRIKRIMPAATLVLVVTVAAAFLVFATSRFQSTFWDAVWAFFFSANWHFAATGTDYFTATGPVSPLQHFWSLSVEEQFYFVWPWMMLLIFIVAGVHIRKRSARTVARAQNAVGITMAVIIVVSFTWALYETTTSPTWAYFSTFSRAWELGAGAIVAVYALKFAIIPAWLRPVLGWAGLTGIIVSLFVVSDQVAFPAPFAVMPVFFTVLVIVAGTGGEQRFLWPLTNPVSIWFGDISYSLYLWHFPVIVILAAIIPNTELPYYLICIGLMMALSVASYYGVENPIRRSRFLEPRTPSRRRRRSSSSSRNMGSILVVGAAGVAAAALCVVALTPVGSDSTAGEVASVEMFGGVSAATPTPTPAATELAAPITDADLVAAADISSWPNQELSVDYLNSLQADDVSSSKCFNNFTDTTKSCTYGTGAGPKVAIIGDSIAMSWAPAIRAAFPDSQVTTYGKYSCPWVDVLVSNSETPTYQSCLDHHVWVKTEIETVRPSVIFVSTADFQLTRLSDGTKGDAASTAWATAMQQTIADLTAAGSRLVVLSNPVPGENLSECATKLNTPLDCVGTVDGQYERMAAAESDGVSQAVEAGMNVAFLDTRAWFCAANGRCPALFDGVPIRGDSLHLGQRYAERIASNMRAEAATFAPELVPAG